MKKILTTTDFSETANNAVDYALMIAKGVKTPVEMELLNVYDIKTELEQAILENHVEKLSRQELFDITLNKYLKSLPKNISLNGTIQKGPIASTISKEAIKKGAELIIMGRDGASGIADWLMGSTTTQVINLSKLPILVIPKIARISPPKKIALAIDDRFVPSDKALTPLFEIVDRFNTELVLFHIEQEEAHSNTHKETVIKIAKKGYLINLFKMNSKNIGAALMTLSKKHDIDLLCVTHHNYSRWESIFHKSISLDIANASMLPFMILHD